MTALAPTLQAFFTTRLAGQLDASPHTIAAYRDTWRMLLRFTARAAGTAPHELDLAQVTAQVVSGFLAHLETARGNSASTRNARLAAIHSFFAYAAVCHPEHAATISQVMAIPPKRHRRTDLTYLTPQETEALLAAPDQATRAGRRDHAMIQLGITAGLRVSELTGVTASDIHFGRAAHVAVTGKGRKNRVTPLDRPTAAVLRQHAATLPETAQFLFPTRSGTRMSRDAVAARLTLHTVTASAACPTLAAKTVTPHVLRHTAAMRLLTAGIDVTVIALWLGHEGIETTQVYLHADMGIKQRALDRTAPTTTGPGRYQPPGDSLLAFLQNL